MSIIALKLLAAVTMLIDHIGQFIPGIPIQLRVARLLGFVFQYVVGFEIRWSMRGYSLESVFAVNYQWMMVFALPFLLLYNGERGKSMKGFYYWFYPAHLLLLYWIGTLMR